MKDLSLRRFKSEDKETPFAPTWDYAIVEGQIAGLEWLDSVDHLLEKDEEGSRTQAYSGLEMDAPHSFQVKD